MARLWMLVVIGLALTCLTACGDDNDAPPSPSPHTPIDSGGAATPDWAPALSGSDAGASWRLESRVAHGICVRLFVDEQLVAETTCLAIGLPDYDAASPVQSTLLESGRTAVIGIAQPDITALRLTGSGRERRVEVRRQAFVWFLDDASTAHSFDAYAGDRLVAANYELSDGM